MWDDGSQATLPDDLVLISDYGSNATDFICGIDGIDEFIQEQALEYSNRNLGETWLLIDDGTVAAFYTVSPTSLSNNSYTGDESPEFEDLDDFRHPVPGLLIGQLGVAEEYQGMEIGRRLIAYIKVWAEAQEVPFWLVQVDSLESSVGFYEQIGFVTSGEDSGDGTTQMFDPLGYGD